MVAGTQLMQLTPVIANHAPALVAAAGARASYRFLEFFTAQIRKPHTRRAYARAAGEFFDWLAAKGVMQLAAIESVHVATYRAAWPRAIRADRQAPLGRLASPIRLDGYRPDHADQSGRRCARAAPYRAAQQDAGARPGRGVTAHRRDRHDECDRFARPRLDRLDGLFVRAHRRGDRDARRGRVFADRRLWVRLHEKGGKQHAMPCHHNLETYLHAYIDGAGLASDPKALLFQTFSRAVGRLTGNPLPQANAYAMIQRRARTAEITTKIGNHTFRATGVTAYLKKWRDSGARGADDDAALRSGGRGSDARRGEAGAHLKARGQQCPPHY